MLIVEFGEIELDACPDCLGIWFDAQELQELLRMVGTAEPHRDWQRELEQVPGTRGRRSCPRCDGRLQGVRLAGLKMEQAIGELTIDRCPHGHGLWFDRGELSLLVRSIAPEQREAWGILKKYLGRFAHPDSPDD